jgi:hypothetical protein
MTPNEFLSAAFIIFAAFAIIICISEDNNWPQ